MNKRNYLLAACICVFVIACKKDLNPETENTLLSTGDASKNNAHPHKRIAIVSDVHYMDPSLLLNGAENGTAFQAYLAQDPKLIQYSAPVFQRVIADLKQERPDILLLPGDITKDGELVSHQAVAGYLSQLRSQGTKVYVIPGNHDINNAKAVQYNGNTATPLQRTQPADFVNIYRNFGYEGTERDPASLSYLAKPYPDLWILAIDASKYEEFGPEGDVADGRIKDATMTWLLAKLAQAKQQNVTVFAMMHHNLVEHYTNQSQLDPGYVIDNWQARVQALMDAGLKIIFTGHYHANDITSYQYNNKELHDIQTGSLVTAPMPYRLVRVKNKKLEVETRTVTNINTPMPGGVSFSAYSNSFLSQHLDNYFYTYLQNKLGTPAELASFASPIYRSAIMAHFAGDENMTATEQAKIATLATFSGQLAAIATILWTDLGVMDNSVTVRYE